MRIGLLNHAFGRPNLGVDALSRSNIAILRAAAKRAGVEPQFILFGKPGSDTPQDADVRQGPFLRLRHLATGQIGPFWKELSSCDLVVDSCAGDGLSDIYGARLFLVHSIGKAAALLARRPLVFAPQTIGPFDRGWAALLAQTMLSRAALTFARDSGSAAKLRGMKAAVAYEETADVAFRLPFEPSPRQGGGVVRVGINVSGLLYRHAQRFGLTLDYAVLTRRMIETVLARAGHEVWLVPHVLHDDDCDEDDGAAIDELAALYPQVQQAPRFRDAVEAKSFISGLDFFAGARMHACIAAMSTGVALAPIAYSRKFNGLFSSLGYDHLIDARALTTAQALARFEQLLEMRHALAPQCLESSAQALSRLVRYENPMCELIASLARNGETGRNRRLSNNRSLMGAGG